MSYVVWIVAGVISALLLILWGAQRQANRDRDRLANLLLTILLDDFAWRRQRDGLMQRLREIEAKDRTILYMAILFELSTLAEENAKRTSAIADRMWQVNQHRIEPPPGDPTPDASGIVTLADPPGATPAASETASEPAQGFYHPPRATSSIRRASSRGRRNHPASCRTAGPASRSPLSR